MQERFLSRRAAGASTHHSDNQPSVKSGGSPRDHGGQIPGHIKGTPDHAGVARAAILMVTYISPLQKWGSAHRSRQLIEALGQHGTVEVLVLSFGAPASEHGRIREHYRASVTSG